MDKRAILTSLAVLTAMASVTDQSMAKILGSYRAALWAAQQAAAALNAARQAALLAVQGALNADAIAALNFTALIVQAIPPGTDFSTINSAQILPTGSSLINGNAANDTAAKGVTVTLVLLMLGVTPDVINQTLALAQNNIGLEALDQATAEAITAAVSDPTLSQALTMNAAGAPQPLTTALADAIAGGGGGG